MVFTYVAGAVRGVQWRFVAVSPAVSRLSLLFVKKDTKGQRICVLAEVPHTGSKCKCAGI